MKLLIIDSTGLLYPYGQSPPSADVEPAGLDFVRRLVEGYGTSVMVAAHDDCDAIELRSWLSAYKVVPTWTLGEWRGDDPAQYVSHLLAQVGQLHATPTMFATASRMHAALITEKNIPACLYIKARDGVPDWRERTSSWSNEEVR